MLKDYRLPPANGAQPKRAIIFLHGLGDNGNGGLLSIGQLWQRDMPDCEFICPDAPFPYDMAPPDFCGRQWFSLQSFAPDALLAGVKKATPYLNEYIDHVLNTRNLTPDQVALVGFSQGTMMALYAGPRRPESLACIVGYSGLLTGGESLRVEKKSSPPVMLIHGQMDEVVPFAAMALAEHMLKSAGLATTTITCPTTGHGVDNIGILEGARFIKKSWGS